MNRKYVLFIFLFLLIFLFTLAGFKDQRSAAQSSSYQQNSAVFTPIEVTVEIQAEGKLLHYKRDSVYHEGDFSEIHTSLHEFSTETIKNFKNDVQRYNKEALNCLYTTDISKHSVTLTCDIQGAMYSTNSYDFHWLLGGLPFDLYQFTQSEKELIYSGKVEGIPTTIQLTFDFPITHCHEHVWPTR